jgi:hypothetical protein
VWLIVWCVVRVAADDLKDHHGSLKRQAYTDLLHKLHKVLVEESTEEECKIAAADDTERDFPTDAQGMDFPRFKSAMFEIADQWTENTGAERICITNQQSTEHVEFC